MPLSRVEMAAIYAHVRAMKFFSYPAEFHEPMPEGVDSAGPVITPDVAVRGSGQHKFVRWSTVNDIPRTTGARNLWLLDVLVGRIIRRRPEYRNLPHPNRLCL